jgi:hypothetical protein
MGVDVAKIIRQSSVVPDIEPGGCVGEAQNGVDVGLFLFVCRVGPGLALSRSGAECLARGEVRRDRHRQSGSTDGDKVEELHLEDEDEVEAVVI